ncbi:MAG: hypothetical protein M1827_004183 [Pycnora praestabilis]|nr:MAG: hypothetical protein M1827_004183 [Pycnora praestabilis]
MSTTQTTETSRAVIQQHLDRLLSLRAYPKTICPSEVARAFSTVELEQAGASEWRDLMPGIRQIVWGMRDQGEVEIMQRGGVLGGEVGLYDVKGPIRVRKKI